jgi:hypothetical protein
VHQEIVEKRHRAVSVENQPYEILGFRQVASGAEQM